MPDFLRTLLSPVLLAQGAWLLKTIPRLPEPSGARTGTRGDGPPLRLLVVGDSSGAGVGVETQDEALLGQTVQRLAERYTVTYRLVARNGSTLPRTKGHLEKLAPEPFDVAVTAIGINDIIGGQGDAAWMASYRDLVRLLRERFGVRHVVASGLPPIGRFPAIPNPLRWVLGRQADALRRSAARMGRDRARRDVHRLRDRARRPAPRRPDGRGDGDATASTPARASTTSGDAAPHRPSRRPSRPQSKRRRDGGGGRGKTERRRAR